MCIYIYIYTTSSSDALVTSSDALATGDIYIYIYINMFLGSLASMGTAAQHSVQSCTLGLFGLLPSDA